MSYKNVEDRKANDKKYREEHREEKNKYCREYYYKNRENELKRMKQRYLCKGKEELFISKYGLTYKEWEG